MLQLHLSDQPFYCLLRCSYIRGLTVYIILCQHLTLINHSMIVHSYSAGQWYGVHFWDYSFGTLSSYTNYCKQFEDLLWVDFFYQYPIFKWVAWIFGAWQGTHIVVPVMAIRVIWPFRARLSCTRCCQYLLNMKCPMYGQLFQQSSTSLGCFCPQTFFLKNGLD